MPPEPERKPRIVLFNESRIFGGIERHLIDLAVGLRAARVPVSILAPADSRLAQRAREASLALIDAGSGRMFAPRALCKLRGLASRGEVDVVHVHSGISTALGALALLGIPRVKLVFTQHFIEPRHRRRKGFTKWLYARAHRWMDKRITRFIAISKAVRTAMIELHPETAEGSIVEILHGITDRAGLAPDRGEARRRLGLPADSLIVATLSRLEPEKNLETLLEAAAVVGKELPSARFLIAGDGEHKPKLVAQADAIGLGEALRFLGFVSDPEALLSAADIVVQPSLNESFGLALIEAMSLGKPVVCFRSGAYAELIETEVSGCLVESDDPVQMAREILRILRTPELRSRLAAGARAAFEKNFTLDNMIESTRRLYIEASSSTRERSLP